MWVCLCRVLNQSVLEGVGCRRRPAAHVELVEDVADMSRDGLLPESQLVRDGAVRPAGCDKTKHLQLAAGQPRGGMCFVTFLKRSQL